MRFTPGSDAEQIPKRICHARSLGVQRAGSKLEKLASKGVSSTVIQRKGAKGQRRKVSGAELKRADPKTHSQSSDLKEVIENISRPLRLRTFAPLR
jgi:hypothetical protein